MFRGTFTAVVTPFRNGDVDFAALEKLIEAQITSGITGIVAVGTTGESPTLTHDEKHEIIERTIKIAKGRCQVIVGAGTNSTRDSIEAAKFAEKAGADGALLVAPYYNKPSQEGLFRHFKAIADATKLPIMLYNIPGRCSVDILPETVVRLAGSCRNIVSIKEASGSVERVGELRRRLPDAFTILSGDDGLTLPFMSVGAAGVVSVFSNLFPAELCALVRACEFGDFKSAENLQRKMGPLFKDLFIEPNPVPVKTALGWRGAISGEVRLPLCEMTDANQARLRRTLAEFEKAK
jgi:4-hydroxy-tetrahydrodipicolinate synthase